MPEQTDHGVLADSSLDELSAEFPNRGVGIRIGPFCARIVCDIDDIFDPIRSFYAAHPRVPLSEVFSYHMRFRSARSWRSPNTRNVRVEIDAQRLHSDLPIEQALPVFEWGMNLVIALRFYGLLMLHAAVLERHGRALVLPAAPGDGKSTLCAGLAFRGWRLLSDEFGIFRPNESALLPVPRPIALKNESIEIIRKFAPDAHIGPLTRGTRKGTVAHVKPPESSVLRQQEPADAALIVFPKWAANSDLELDEVAKSEAFMRLGVNSFNYEPLGAAAFRTIRSVIDCSSCYELRYSNLEDATAALSRLADNFE